MDNDILSFDPASVIASVSGQGQSVPQGGGAQPSQQAMAQAAQLIGGLTQQESGGRQTDASGNPITSSKGAVGIAQVMPGTAPEAAALAGLPWDANRYRTDQNYNLALGQAYLAKQLQTFGGDPQKALAAYNAGPGAVRQAIAQGGNNWLSLLPQETQAYVPGVLSKSGQQTQQSQQSQQTQQTQQQPSAYFTPDTDTYATPQPAQQLSMGDYASDVGSSVASAGRNLARGAENIGRSLVGGAADIGNQMGLVSDDTKNAIDDANTAAIGANQKASQADTYQPKTIAGEVAGAVTSMAPALALSIIPGVGPVLGMIAFGAQGAASAGMSAIDQGDSLANAQMKAIGQGALNTALGAVIGGAGNAVLSKLPVVGGVFDQTAADTLTAIAQRAAQGAGTMALFKPAGAAIDYAADKATGDTIGPDGQPKHYDFMPGVSDLITGALVAMPHAGAEYLQRNNMPARVTQLPDGTVGLAHQVGNLFSSPDAANSFIKANQLDGATVMPVTQKLMNPDAKTDNVIGYVVKPSADMLRGNAPAPSQPAPTVKPGVQAAQDAAQNQDSPLSKAATAGNAGPEAMEQATTDAQSAPEQAAPQQPGQQPSQPQADPIAAQVAAVQQQARAPGFLQALRGPDSPVDTRTFLNDLATASSPSSPIHLREQAMTRLNFAAEWAKQNSPATEAAPLEAAAAAPGEPAQSLAAPEATAPDLMAQHEVDQRVAAQQADQQHQTDLANAERQAARQPDANSVIDALQTQPFNRTAEQTSTLARARATYSPDDMALLSRAAVGPFQLNATENLRLSEMRKGTSEEPAAQPEAIEAPRAQAEPAAAEAPAPEAVAPREPAAETPAQPKSPGPLLAPERARRAQHLEQLADAGFDTVEPASAGWTLRNSRTGQGFLLHGPADAQLARAAIKRSVDKAAHEAASSPHNDLSEPTQGQKEAGNYKVGRIANIGGVRIAIENPQGSTRRGVSPDGKPWETKLAHHYGYIEGTKAIDGDAVDAFIGPRPDSRRVFVVDQRKPDGSFDEHKVMLGFTSEEAARKGYLDNYEPGWNGLMHITEMAPDQFKTWAHSDAAKRPAYESGNRVVSVNANGRDVPLPLLADSQLPKGGVTPEQAGLLRKVADVFGKKVEFFADPTKSVGDGFVYRGDDNTIYLNGRGSISALSVLGHEVTHEMRRELPQAYDAVAAVVRERMGDAEGFMKFYGDKELTPDQMLEEMTADIGGDLLRDPTFWREVVGEVERAHGDEAYGIVAQLAAFVNRMLDKVASAFKGERGFGSERFLKDATGVRDAFRKALAQYAKEAGVSKAKLQADMLREKTEQAAASRARDILTSPVRVPEDEVEAVRRKYEGTDQWMRAPNGQRTGLSERQWLHVRTPAFKQWFGDWEKHAGEAGSSHYSGGEASVVVNRRTGEPLVVFHGTSKGGFDVFNGRSGERRGELGIFATDNQEMAATYARRGQPKRIAQDDLQSQRAGADRVNGVYALFMNIRRPLESDFEGANWDGSRDHQWAVEVGGELQSNAAGHQYFTNLRRAKEFANDFVSPEAREEGISAGDYVRTPEDHFETTDSVAREAAKNDNDGAIIYNVIDDGGGAHNGYINEPADLFLAFDPNQVKSADFNDGNYSQADDHIQRSTDRGERDQVRVGLSAATSSISGLRQLQNEANAGDASAQRLLNNVAYDSLRRLTDGIGSVQIDRSNDAGLYFGELEPSLGIGLSFDGKDRPQVMAALARFADNFNQQQIHVRQATDAPAGQRFDDGSFATVVRSIDLKEPLSRERVQAVIDASGLVGMTYNDRELFSYFIGNPNDARSIEEFERGFDRAVAAVGENGAGARRETARLWVYGRGAVAGEPVIPFDQIAGDVRAGAGQANPTAARVAERLTGQPVQPREQREITPQQRRLQTEIKDAYEAMPRDDLGNPLVRRAYDDLTKEAKRQFEALPVKVEVLTGQGEPYANSDAMRRDVLDHNHLYIFGTEPDTFGPAGIKYDDHPLLRESGLKDQNGRPLLYNDLLRAVHDYYAHTLSPVQFGPKGEEAAWANHMAMTMSPWARWALTSETRGQNSWVNFRPGIDRVPMAERGFAEQKVGLLPIKYAMTGSEAMDAPMRALERELGDKASGSLPADWKAPEQPIRAAGVESGERPSYGEPIEGSVSATGYHFGKESRPTLSTSAYGRGLRGAEAERLTGRENDDIRPRTHFYVDTGNGIHPESGVGANAHSVDLRNLYNVTADPKDIVRNNPGANNWERAVMRAGYDGYLSTDPLSHQGYAVVLGKHEIPVREMGPAASRPGAAVKLSTERLEDQSKTQADRAEPAPVFYSQLQRAIEGVPDRLKTMAAPMWAQWLKANASKMGVKADEIEWSGINDYLKLRGKDKITSDELAQWLNDGGVQVQEKLYGDNPMDPKRVRLAREYERLVEEAERAGDSTNPAYIEDKDADRRTPREQALLDAYNAANENAEESAVSDTPDAKFGAYVTPGGNRYSELLLKLPARYTNWTQAQEAELNRLNAMNNRGELDPRSNPDGAKAFKELLHLRQLRSSDPSAFRSAHWDDRDVLAHIRFDAREDAEGNPVMFIQELQSDWAQAARKHGIRPDADAVQRSAAAKMAESRSAHEEAMRLADEVRARAKAFRAANPDAEQISDELLAQNRADSDRVHALMSRALLLRDEATTLNNSLANKGKSVPAGPYINDTKAWVSLALKRAIRWAADNGFDSVAFAKGDQNVDLYDLSKHIDSITYGRWVDGGDVLYNINANDRRGDSVFNETSVDIDRIEEVFGKEIAEKIKNGEGEKLGHADDSGRELSGLDLKVGGEGMRKFYDEIVPQIAKDVIKKIGGNGLKTVDMVNSDGSQSKQTGFEITPKMRDEALAGQALFSRARDPEAERALAELSKADDLFALPKSDKDTVAGIAADNDSNIKVKQTKVGAETLYTLTMPEGGGVARLWVRPENPHGERVYSMELHDGKAVNKQAGRPGENPEDVPPEKEDVYLDVSQLKPGEQGSKVYNIAATFAHNTGRIFIGDPSGLSDVAMRRRLENMISSALKFGTTDHIAPHPRQVEGDSSIGVPPLKWVYGDHVGNIERMIDASVKAAENSNPELKAITYDPATGQFIGGNGNPIPRDRLVTRAREDRSGGADLLGKGQAGWRTVARNALFRSLRTPEAGSQLPDRGSLLDRLGQHVAGLRSEQGASGAGASQARIFYSRARGVSDDQGTDRSVGPDSAGLRGNVHAASAVQHDTVAPAGDYYTRTIVGRDVKRQVGARKVLTPADAAAATNYLYKSAVEHFDGIVTDKGGKPLAVIGGFKGALGQASVYPGTMVGEAVRIPGAATVWFSHNHPSGNPVLSRADEHLYSTLKDAFKGSGIEPKGILAIGEGRYSWTDGYDHATGEVPTSKASVRVPAIEREVAERGAAGASIDSPNAAVRTAISLYDSAKAPGLMLLDSQYRLVAWVPLPDVARGDLRGTGGLNAIYRAVSESNAGNAIIVHGGELDADVRPGVTLAQNIGAALKRAEVSVLDTINTKTGESGASRGRELALGPVFSRSRAADNDARDAAFAKWSNNAPLVTSAQANGHEFKTGEKIVVEAFHGSARPDRVGKVFDPKRATSGPMAYFTSSPELASRYAEGKPDTSRYNEDQSYQHWFKFKPQGSRGEVPIDRAWHSLTPEQRRTIAERMPDIRMDDDGNVIYEKGGGDPGSYGYELAQTKRGYDRTGNPLAAAVETWLNSGALFGDEGQFLDVLRLSGFPMRDVRMDDPGDTFPGVFKTFVKMNNPLVTSDIPDSTRAALERAAKTSRASARPGADMWAKNSRTMREWLDEFNDPERSAYAWTSIPDKVTNTLKALGYDGIVDWSGKGGGEEHPVYIPFEPTQVKGAFNRGTFDEMKRDFNFSRSRVIDIPDAVIGNNLGDAAEHKDYQAAKGGDEAAAVRVARDLVTPGLLEKVKALAGDTHPIVVPVVAEEAAGRNKIPRAAAEVLAHRLGLETAHSIVQANRAHRTGMDGLDRIFAPVEFSGDVKRGQSYLLVDDTLTQGGTFAALADHIDSGGGRVVGVVALTGKQYSAKISPDQATIDKLRSKHGDLEDDFRAATGHGFDALTQSEARYLANYEPAQRLRDRIVEEGRRAGAGTDAGDAQPGVDGVSRSTDRDDSATGAWQTPSASKFDDLVYRLQNKHVDTLRVIDAIKATGKEIRDDLNVYLQEELFHGRAAKRTEEFVDFELNPLVESMRQHGLTIDDLDEFLHARHAPEANKLIASREPAMQDGGSGMTNAEAAAYMQQLAPERRAQLDAAAAKVDAMIEKTRQLMVDYELESKTKVQGWRDSLKTYVPLMREDDGAHQGAGTGQGFSIRGKEVKGRTGSQTRKVVDILGNVAMQRERTIVRGEKNRVSRALVGLAEANPNDGFWTVDQVPTERVYNDKTNTVEDRPDPMFKQRENALVAKIADANGDVHEHAVVFNDRDPRALRMARALKNMDAAQMEGLLGASAKITRYFASINTQYNPVFGVVNLTRDVQEAMLNLQSTALAGQQKKVLRYTAQALSGIYSDLRGARKGQGPQNEWGKLWDDFTEHGGQTGYRQLFANSADRVKAIEKTLTPEGWMDSKLGKVFTANGALKVPMRVAQKQAGWLFDWLSDYNEAMENGVRLAAYRTGLEQGLSKERAASIAKNLTVNFNRKGAITQQAGALFAFFNASVQGTARVAQTMFTMEPGKPKTIRLSPFGMKVVAGGMLLGVVQQLMLAAAGFNDNDPPQFARETSLIIPTGGKTYVSIPMAQGFRILPSIGRTAMEFAMGGFKHPTERILNLVSQMTNSYSPIGGSGLSIQSITPTPLAPIAALSENKDFTGRPIARTSHNKAIPGYTLARDTSSTLGTLIAQGINSLTGGSKYLSGVVSPTPDQVDYLLSQTTGGVGKELMKIDTTTMGLVRGDDVPTFKWPALSRFFGNANQPASQGQDFYANVDNLNRLQTEIKERRKDGDYAGAQAVRMRNPEAYLATMAAHAEQQVSKLRRQKFDAIKAGASRDAVKAIDDRMVARMSALNRAVEALSH